MKSFSVEAVVLRLRALGEADRIITLFSRERGKHSAVARGARKVANKFGARLDFFSRVSLMLHEGKSLDAITSVQTVSSIWEKLVEPDAFAAASYVAETIDALCEPDLAVPDVYEALCQFQKALALNINHDELLAAMDLRLLDALGFAPELEGCARCGKVLGRRPLKGGRAQLSAQAGGLVCDECAHALRAEITGPGHTHVVSVGAREFARLRELRRPPFEQLSTSSMRSNLHRITQPFVEFQMGRRSRVMAVEGAGARLRRTATRRT